MTMYKCKECGCEYEIKPDYCDCGNDEFEEAAVKEIPVESQKNIQSAEKKDQKTKEISSSSTVLQKPEHKTHLIHCTDSISLIIFCLCLILSAYVIFFAWNPKDTVGITEQKMEVSVSKNIPSIDKFWNDTLPVVTEPIKKEEAKSVKTEEKTVKQLLPQQTTVAPKTTSNKKPSATSQNKSSQTQKPVSKTTVNKKAQEKAKKSAEEAAKKKAEQEAAKKQAEESARKAQEEEQAKKLAEEKAKKVSEEKARQSALAKQELSSYKAKLRNTIGQKIDFTKVIGDGSCTVAFKIDSSGKLVSRSFAKQSSNITLNDAVYNAVMSTPRFNPPPSAYKSEMLYLSIKFYNGNFEIALP